MKSCYVYLDLRKAVRDMYKMMRNAEHAGTTKIRVFESVPQRHMDHGLKHFESYFYGAMYSVLNNIIPVYLDPKTSTRIPGPIWDIIYKSPTFVGLDASTLYYIGGAQYVMSESDNDRAVFSFEPTDMRLFEYVTDLQLLDISVSKLISKPDKITKLAFKVKDNGHDQTDTTSEQSEKKDPKAVPQDNLTEFTNTGLVLFMNQFLMMFGFVLKYDLNPDTGISSNLRVCKTKDVGFSEESINKALEKFQKFMQSMVIEEKKEEEIKDEK